MNFARRSEPVLGRGGLLNDSEYVGYPLSLKVVIFVNNASVRIKIVSG